MKMDKDIELLDKLKWICEKCGNRNEISLIQCTKCGEKIVIHEDDENITSNILESGKVYKYAIILLFIILLIPELCFLCFIVFSTINGSIGIFSGFIFTNITIFAMIVTILIMYMCTIFNKIIIGVNKITLNGILVKQVIPIIAFKDAKIDIYWGKHIRIYILEKIYRVYIRKDTCKEIINIISMTNEMNNKERDVLINKIRWYYYNIFGGNHTII
jgi:DNA-directed RNA polymerase subunit RPC12/RpoP